MRPSDHDTRIVAALIVAAGVAAWTVSIFSEQLGLGADVARGTFGWKRTSLLVAGGIALAVGGLLMAHPRFLRGLVDWEELRPWDRNVRTAAALFATAGAAACGLAVFAEELSLGAEAARGVFGWKRVSLLLAGAVAVVVGALLVARPRIVSRHADGERIRRSWERMQGGWERVRAHGKRDRKRNHDPPTANRSSVDPSVSSRKLLIASTVAAIAAFIPRAMTAGQVHRSDEETWMGRSVEFSDALLKFDFSAASATTGETATMPGVTTMWLGTIARGAWELGRVVGLVDESGSFADSAVGLHLSQLAVAVATSVLIGLFVVLAWRWAGAIAAIVAGALLATEPFFVAFGSVLHTDMLAGLFAATGTLALLIALGVAGGVTTRPRATAALAGVLLAGALLSKLSVLLLAPGLALVVIWALVRVVRRERPRREGSLAALRPVGGLLGIVLAAGLATMLVAWPAIWADPLNQVSLLRDSAGMGERGHPQFFRGEVTETPGPLFYLITTPFLMTPWFLVGTVLVIAGALVRSTRPPLAALALVAIPALIGLSLASKQFGRYVLLILPLFALAVGIGLSALWARPRHDRPTRRIARSVAGTATLLMLAHALWVAPLGLIYVNPLLGDSRAERTILIGGFVGQLRAGELIEDREAPACDVTIAVHWVQRPLAYPCGSLVSRDDDPDYYVIAIDGRQRDPTLAQTLRGSGRTVGVVTIRGIVHAEIIDTREP